MAPQLEDGPGLPAVGSEDAPHLRRAAFRMSAIVRPPRGPVVRGVAADGQRPFAMLVDLDAVRTGPEPKWTDQSHAEYLAEWYLWRALRRDDRLDDQELRARHDGLVAFITTRVADRAPGL